MSKKNTNNNKNSPIISAELKAYLEPELESARSWHELTDLDLFDFKSYLKSKPDDRHKRRYRREIKKWFGKAPSKLTLEEFKDYNKPSFQAQEFLRKIWDQLELEEQELVKQLNRWAFVFASSFDKEEQFLRACAERLERILPSHPKLRIPHGKSGLID